MAWDVCNAFIAFALCQSLFPIAFQIEMNWYNFHSVIAIANDSYQLFYQVYCYICIPCVYSLELNAFSAIWNLMSLTILFVSSFPPSFPLLYSLPLSAIFLVLALFLAQLLSLSPSGSIARSLVSFVHSLSSSTQFLCLLTTHFWKLCSIECTLSRMRCTGHLSWFYLWIYEWPLFFRFIWPDFDSHHIVAIYK